MKLVANTESDLWQRIDVGLPDHCWSYRTDLSSRGYGRFSIGGKRDYAHRFVYKICVGPILPGQVVDHVCHNSDLNCNGGPECEHRKCCNPYHMELKTSRGNLVASHRYPGNITVCSHGHEYTEENTYWRPDGKGRQCRQCIKRRSNPMWNRDAKEPGAHGCPGK